MTRATLGPAVAGTWYPADPRALADQVDGYLRPDEAPAGPSLDEDGATTPVVGVIAPHAGFVYSGGVAGAAFRRLQGARYDTVLLIGPSHYEGYDGVALPRADRYSTPLGDVELDREAIDRLSRLAGFKRTDRPFVREHCLEAELPFLQRTLADGWRLIPALVGGATGPETLDALASGLRGRLGPETLVVVSSDFTHYGPRFAYVPFEPGAGLPDRIRDLDLGAVQRIVDGDRRRFRDYVDATGATICGRAAIDLMLGILPEGSARSLVAYETSGNLTGDWDHSVSYASLLFRGPALTTRRP